ncbi:alpha-scruin-like [Rhipicephalus microplus]|uniref:alpha-scruin-like n=1 Tax=Rhipicephalus microplus TaxID=6941 RepID=UPI003F6D9BBA
MTPERMSPGLRQLKQAQQPGDPCFPVILVIGGLDPRNPLGSGSTVLKYHPLKDRWTLVNVMPEPRSYHAVAHINDSIFVTGGYSTLNRKSGEMAATKTTFIMNTKTGNWERLPDMLDERACHASVATDGRIIAFGGRGHDGSWTTGPQLRLPRAFASATIIHGNIWLCGGCMNIAEERHPVSVDSIDVGSKHTKWKKTCTLGVARHSASIAIIGSCIYIFGGINSQEWGVLSKSTLVITDKKAVVSACPMPQPLSGHSAVTLLPTSSQHSLCSSKWSDAIYAKYV